MESDIHLSMSAPVVFLKFKVVAFAGQVFLALPSFARRMKSEKNRLAKTVEPRSNGPRYNDVPAGITTIIPTSRRQV